ncbi:RHS repeat-associated core domain-containing protein [Planctomycetota bacterium]
MTKTYFYTNDSRIVSNNSMNCITDRLGSVRLIVDSAGRVRHSYTYTPFGQMLQTDSDQGAPTNNFKFTGQWLDNEIGQYYLRARMYDPQLMRFTLHEYLYCTNDPTNKIDLSGRLGAGFEGHSTLASQQNR